MISINVLTPSDYDSLVSLWEKAGLPHRPKGRDSRQAISKQMEENPSFFLGAFLNDELVGCVVASYDGRKGWINRLAVLPEHRRKGIAQQLLSQAEKVLMEKGAEVIGVLIFNTNAPSLSFFEKMGYEPMEEIVYLSKRESAES